MKNPLIRRIPRNLKSDWHKYAVIIIFMVLMIGVISGMYVGHDSMLEAVYSGRDTLNLEDGSFEISSEATGDFLDSISEKEEVIIYDNFYVNASEDNDNDGEKDATVRVFTKNSKINKVSLNDGRFPDNNDEIAIDRMHADNVGVKIGDIITIDGKQFRIVGLISYVNYLTLHETNTDLMFDAFGFDVAMVTEDAFDSITSRVHYNYAYQYIDKTDDKHKKADRADDFIETLMKEAYINGIEVTAFLPEYLRQSSNFAISDIEGDSVGAEILCYILIGVIAFIFAITISNTVDKEAPVIGTLRASGYSRTELTVHYMSMPIIVTVLGALIGNILGYTVFKDVAVDLYYQSYSLPTCYVVWSDAAIFKTTVIPLVLMFFINLIVIVKKLKLSPLHFLRHDLTRHKRSKAMRLPKWSFMRRFRLRVFFQNVPNYLVLIFGVIFIELMLCFAFGLPDSLDYYAKKAPDMMFTEYQYILMGNTDATGQILDTSEKTAERFNVMNLMYPKKKSSFREGMGSGGDEGVTVYGVVTDSKYVKLSGKTKNNEICISSAFSHKFGIKKADKITLNAEYEDKAYSFTVKDIIDYDGGIAAFMDIENFNETFGREKGDFSGYFSHNEITDIDNRYIASIITADDVRKVTNQLNHSMGGAMGVFKHALIVLTAALIYLLAKIIIERNEHAISMTKILGFTNGEIGSLYIVPTAIVVLLFAVVGLVIGYFLMIWIFHVFMLQMDGYFAFYMSTPSLILSVLYLLIGYAFVSLIDYIRIRHIPMDVALKRTE